MYRFFLFAISIVITAWLAWSVALHWLFYAALWPVLSEVVPSSAAAAARNADVMWCSIRKNSDLMEDDDRHPDAASLGRAIVRQALLFKGLVESRPNASWDDPATPGPDAVQTEILLKVMGSLGWKPGQPYCMAFAGAMVSLAVSHHFMPTYERSLRLIRVRQLITPGCVETAKRARLHGLLSDFGSPGALWIAQHGDTPRGHAGVVTAWAQEGQLMKTLEGNTDDAGSREGDGIFEKLRDPKRNGSLHTLGFIHPDAWL